MPALNASSLYFKTSTVVTLKCMKYLPLFPLTVTPGTYNVPLRPFRKVHGILAVGELNGEAVRAAFGGIRPLRNGGDPDASIRIRGHDIPDVAFRCHVAGRLGLGCIGQVRGPRSRAFATAFEASPDKVVFVSDADV